MIISRVDPTSIAQLDRLIIFLTAVERAVAPSGQLGQRAATVMADSSANYAQMVSPYWTGELSRSHIHESSSDGRIVYIDPTTRNPITGDPPAIYGPQVHERDRRSAFYDRTVSEAGLRILGEGTAVILAGIDAL